MGTEFYATKSVKCFSARIRSAFFNLSFFSAGNLWTVVSVEGVEIGSDGEPSGNEDGRNAIVPPCRDKHSEQGR